MIVNKETKIAVGDTMVEKVYQGDTILYDNRPFNYIEDNLYILCDGIQNSANGHISGTPTIWKNLKGNIDIQFATNTPWSITKNAMKGYAPANTQLQDSKLSARAYNINLGRNWTIEEHMTINSAGGSRWDSAHFFMALCNGSSVSFCNFFRNNCAISCGGYCGDFYNSTETFLGQRITLTTVYNGTQFKIYINGVLVATASNTYFYAPPQIAIGPERMTQSWYESKDYDVDFHSVRCYNRALTDEEIQYNYEIDVKRFK